MSNHLIIGLGGTGGKVLREFRKRIYEEYGSNNQSNPKQGEYFEYVYVDSSVSDLNERWSIMGTDVSLSNAQKVSINNVASGMLANLKAYPGLEAFMTANEVSEMNAKIGPAITAGIGGQRRRLGRILLAADLANINNQQNFEHTIRAAVGRLHAASGMQNVTFHICAGLAGGTGSGTVIDTIALLREWFPYNVNTGDNKILLMLYVPESLVVNQKHDAGYYQANGYAALQELNALGIDVYKPCDITGRKTLDGQHARISAGFEAAYVYSNTTESGQIKDLENRLPADVAEFLFQSISVSGGQLQRLANCENNPPTPENNQAGVPSRCRKFLTFGVTRIEYPEVEIRQFATYSFAVQAARGLLYNYWLDSVGYDVRTMEQVGTSYSTEVRNVATYQKLMLTDGILSLSEAIIQDDNTSSWKKIHDTWRLFSDRTLKFIQQHIPQKDWQKELLLKMNDYYNNAYRSCGVQKFYQLQSSHIEAYASHICHHIENVLFKEWMSGGKSMLEVLKYIDELISASKERIKDYTPLITKHQSDLQKFDTEADGVKKEWDNIGVIGERILGRCRRVISSYQTALENKYREETMVLALQYAQTLLTAIEQKLEILRTDIDDVNGVFIQIAEDATKEAAARCLDQMPNDGIVRLYNPQKLRQIVHQLETNASYQTQTISRILRDMASMAGSKNDESFSSLHTKLDHQSAVGLILSICEQEAAAAMQNYGIANPGSKLIDVNILEKLRTSFKSQSDMKDFVTGIIGNAMCNIQFDNTQAGTLSIPMLHMLQLRIPSANGNEDTQFRSDLINEFAMNFPGFTPSSDVALCDRNSRIVVVCAWSNMPLRVVSNTSVLKDKYENLVSPNRQGCGFNRLLLHTESFKSNFLPQLFDLTPNEIKTMSFAPLLTAFALDMLPQQFDPNLGQNVYVLQETTVTGLIPHALGLNFAECWKTLEGDYNLTAMLMGQVEQKLGEVAITKPQKDDIVKRINTVMQQQVLTSLCESSSLHPKWAYYNNEAANLIMNRLS